MLAELTTNQNDLITLLVIVALVLAIIALIMYIVRH